MAASYPFTCCASRKNASRAIIGVMSKFSVVPLSWKLDTAGGQTAVCVCIQSRFRAQVCA